MPNHAPILLDGQWIPGHATGTFRATNPALSQPLDPPFPISSREDVLAMIEAGAAAAPILAETSAEQIAKFLRSYADRIEADRARLVELAHHETGYEKDPRLDKIELPRTTDQLRQAATAAEKRSWKRPIIDRKANIRSMFGPLYAPVVVMGPNNFPFAYSSVAGGDFAAAIVAGNPVIAKANLAHPATAQRLTELALAAVLEADLPRATVQLLYHIENELGFELVSHPLIGASAFTGSKAAGLKLKEAADRAGKPIYLEMSSINPVVLLPGALRTRLDKLADEFCASCLLSAGQFCTNPGLVLMQQSPESERFVRKVLEKFETSPPGILLGANVRDNAVASVKKLTTHGARIVTGGHALPEPGYHLQNTLLTVEGEKFLQSPPELQTEVFGPVSLFVLADDLVQLRQILSSLEGNLTGSIYSAEDGSDDAAYREIESLLRRKVGRLLNDKMPTGVTVTPAMNHGGPFPATGHPGFTAVGIPTSVPRFAALHCYDHVRADRLPPELRDDNPLGIEQSVA